MTINVSNITNSDSSNEIASEILKNVLSFSGVIIKGIVDVITKFGIPTSPAIVILVVILLLLLVAVIKFVFQIAVKIGLVVLICYLFAGFFTMK
jgi:hypothetical protein